MCHIIKCREAISVRPSLQVEYGARRDELRDAAPDDPRLGAVADVPNREFPLIELRLAVPKLSILDGAIMLTDVNLNVFGTQSTTESELRTYVFYDAADNDGGKSGGESGGAGGTYLMTKCSVADDVAEEEAGACKPPPPLSAPQPSPPATPPHSPPRAKSPPPPKSLMSSPPPPPPSPPPSGVCSSDNMVAGCKCASDGFGHGKPDNPLSSTGLCCDESSKKTVKGAQVTSWAGASPLVHLSAQPEPFWSLTCPY